MYRMGKHNNLNSLLLRLGVASCIVHIGHSLSSAKGQTTRNIATQVLQGTGPAAVNMNDYNLPLEKIEQEWTAVFVQKIDENVEKAYLSAKTDDEIFADYVTVAFPRSQGSLGIELAEFAGGRDDGLGITLVQGLVPGGSADRSDILPGDSLTKIVLVRNLRERQGSRITENEQIFTVGTECLSYDYTVEKIISLPPVKEGYEDTFQVTVKRLRRRPKVTINLQYPPDQGEEDTTIEMYAGENLRQGMLVRGVKLNDPLAKRFDTKSEGNCGAGGLCRTCSVSVLSGGEMLNPQRVAEKQMLEGSPRWRLACKAIVGFGMKEGEMTIRVNPRQW
jgi:ferredoxin